MDDGGPSAMALVILLLLLVLDMIVYGFGAAIHNLKVEDLEDHIPEEDGEQSGEAAASSKETPRQFLLDMVDNPTEYVNAIQLLMFGINMVIGCIYIPLIADMLKAAFPAQGSGSGFLLVMEIIALLLLLYVFLTVGVLLPKSLARRSPLNWAKNCTPLIHVIMILLRPFTFLIEKSVHGILYLGGVRDFVDETDVTEEEIRSMVSEGQEQGVLQDSEANMITNIFEFSDKEVRDIMTHRNDVVGIDAANNLGDAIGFMLQGNNSRFPVYLDSIDHIIGIIHIRDAMQKVSENDENGSKEVRQIKGLMRQPMYVPETRKIESLFHSMQSTKTQIAIVIDEYGQTVGLVSMEDILEEIVGNIMDEYDEDERYITPSGKPGEFTVLGKTPLEALEKRFDIDFHEEEFETLNGFLISRMDRIPEENETFECNIEGYSFRILSVQNHMITDVAIRKVDENGTENRSLSDDHTTEKSQSAAL